MEIEYNFFGTAGGKLLMTWYPGRTYRFYKGPVVYPFGHGLSYTRFVHSIADAPTVVGVQIDGHRGFNTSLLSKSIRVTHAKCNKLSIGVHVDAKNVGSKDGTHTLLVFSTPPPGGNHWAPHKQLVAFEKVGVAAKSQQRVLVKIHVCKYLSVVDRAGIRRIPMGEHTLHIGDHIKHSVSIRATNLGVIKS